MVSIGLPNAWRYLTEMFWKLCLVMSVEEVPESDTFCVCSGRFGECICSIHGARSFPASRDDGENTTGTSLLGGNDSKVACSHFQLSYSKHV